MNQVAVTDRVRTCGRTLVSDQGVPVVVADGIAHFRNVATCGSVHACPVCGPKIRERRATEIAAALRQHYAAGGGAEFVTLTVPHHYGERLDVVHQLVANAWHALERNRPGRDLRSRAGVVGTIAAREVTHGPNGWHPHLHVLYLTEVPLAPGARARLQQRLSRLWGDAVEAAGGPRPSWSRGCKVVKVEHGDGIARYTSKVYDELTVAHEMARADRKEATDEHRSPIAILADALAGGDVADLTLWWEYERAMFRRRALTWSRGLKARFDLRDRTDEDIAAEDAPGGEVIAVIAPPVWRYIAHTRWLRAEVLTMAETEGEDGVAELLARIEQRVYGELLPFSFAWRGPGEQEARERRTDERRLAFLRRLRSERPAVLADQLRRRHDQLQLVADSGDDACVLADPGR